MTSGLNFDIGENASLIRETVAAFAKKEIEPVVKICIMCCHCHNYVANVIIILRNQNTIKPFFNFSEKF